MIRILKRYTRWLHTQWPAGHVEKLPLAGEDGATNVPGLYLVGDITGIPLLKFSSHSGARAVQAIAGDPAFRKRDRDAERDGRPVLDVLIIGAGVSGVAAAMEARKAGLSFEVLEAGEPLATIVNFPRGKPIYTYPTGMTPAGDLQFTDRAAVKEGLVEELRGYLDTHGIEPVRARADRVRPVGGVLEITVRDREPYHAHRVVVGIGRSGNFRRLGVPGEDLDKVYNRLHDPKDFCEKHILIVGGGDSALETAIALVQCGAQVTISYRKPEFSRPKPQNLDAINRLAEDATADVAVEEPVSARVTAASGGYLGRHWRPGAIRLMMSSQVKEIRDEEVVITDAAGHDETLPNDVVFTMIGREPPLDFFRRSGVRIRGEWRMGSWIGLILFFAFCVLLYHWKSDAGFGVKSWFMAREWFPFNIVDPTDAANLAGTLRLSFQKPSFYYTLAYSTCIVLFGIKRIRRRRTPYVTAQTLTLMAIQVVPLFLLPFVLLPWAGHNGWFETGAGGWIADQLFPLTEWDNHGREYWRSVGFILAWPLLPWNVFSGDPMLLWLAISLVQTFVIIPLLVWRWGKGAYCGWICSCGALAETMGDAHRHKMPHGPIWNRLNMIGQLFLVFALALLLLRVVSWLLPGWYPVEAAFWALLYGGGGPPLKLMSYEWFVDLLFAGILGVAFYFWLSGRVWCRFACPLAALMHIYARFSRFRIVADKSKCISCNVCTSVCHQGIDIMNFANKGLPMEDPECVRCSACVQGCPTGVLQFGQVNPTTGEVLSRDRLAASRVLIAEGKKKP
ncbi:MAG: NAD(P)-binding domain-containing protein [Planctomycetota bacterium]|jgi:thioredoxin reductase/Fe-S-cluster-containing hydrogenase component 2